jgi:high affinity Mn2+ porin
MLRRAAPLLLLLLWSAVARGQAASPAGHDTTSFDIMNLLAERGFHDLEDERWNVYGQLSYITVFKAPFTAPYTNANGSINSLNTDFERSFTFTASLYFGVRLWKGGELYFAPEAIAERPLSDLHGIGSAIQIFELQKRGSEIPAPYRARLFFRQTFSFGGGETQLDSNPLQLGGKVSSRRVVLTLGNYSVIDVFDKNNVTWDPRQTFFNMAFMTHASFDFPADARGYTVGGAAELYWDDWALRLGHFAPPKEPNDLSLDFQFWEHYGDVLELEHDHVIRGRPGAIRLLGYRNQVLSGRFDAAIDTFLANPQHNAGNCPAGSYNYGSGNFSAPDLCWVRHTNVKLGIGINVEQYVADDVGLFLRAMYSDGDSEVDAYDAADSDFSFGAVAKGTLWKRPLDVAGLGVQLAWISAMHARYLAMGGVDGFIGDGHLRRAPEAAAEVFYSFNILRAIWVAATYQVLWNPGFNADRPGPVHMPGVKVHAEF